MERTLTSSLKTRLALPPFGRDEDGALTIFSVFLIIAFLMAGGLSLDIMRAETTRMRLQETADRATLAAASSTQLRDSKTVVKDYFARAGLSNTISDESIVVTPLTAGESVQVTATSNIPASFMRLIGVEGWEAQAVAAASEAINKVEISLVLDVSGSMGDNNRLVNAKKSAKSFVDTIFENSATEGVAVSLVPYSSQVALPDSLAAQFDIDIRHQHSTCVDFSSTDYDDLEIPADVSLVQTGHFDPWTEYRYSSSVRSTVCPTGTQNEILPYSGSQETIKNRINTLVADGATSIDIGMKWGLGLLDPDADTVVDGLIALEEVDAVFDDRPYEYDDNSAMKVIVLMTDGQNTTEYQLRSEYTTQSSDFWIDASTDRMSLETRPPSNTWFQCSLNNYNGYYTTWYRGRRYCKTSSSTHYVDLYYAYHNSYWYSEPYGNNPSELSFDELWEETNVDYAAYMRYLATGDADDYYNYNNEPYRSIDGNTKDSNLLSLCEKAKAEGVLVFTIGFEAPSSSADLLEDCATSPAYAFDVEGLDIEFAFEAIASSINTLRLTK